MQPKLFMLILGGRPPGRHTEQHDVFFAIGQSLSHLLDDIKAFWPQAKIHIDSWREVTSVDGYEISVLPKEQITADTNQKLFFLNLGGYKPNDMEEYHYKLLAVAPEKGDAIKQAKQTAFYKHTGFKGATSHIDDKFGIDVDDFFEIKDILPQNMKDQYKIVIKKAAQEIAEDVLHIGYLNLSAL